MWDYGRVMGEPFQTNKVVCYQWKYGYWCCYGHHYTHHQHQRMASNFNQCLSQKIPVSRNINTESNFKH